MEEDVIDETSSYTKACELIQRRNKRLLWIICLLALLLIMFELRSNIPFVNSAIVHIDWLRGLIGATNKLLFFGFFALIAGSLFNLIPSNGLIYRDRWQWTVSVVLIVVMCLSIVWNLVSLLMFVTGNHN